MFPMKVYTGSNKFEVWNFSTSELNLLDHLRKCMLTHAHPKFDLEIKKC